jgi:extracellular factor (EF) 3-hydroxypalmitic acid methyl ester biosynthesis protein
MTNLYPVVDDRRDPLPTPSLFQSHEEAALLDHVVADVERHAATRQIPDADGLHLSATMSHRLMLGIASLESAGWSRAEILARLESVRVIHGASPFIRRLQEWPRGYPGDFETVEYLVQQQNRAPRGTLAFWLEQYALQSPIAQQHRNKVHLQARAILETVWRPPVGSRESRVLILAAGGSPDLREIQSLAAGAPFRAVLLDQDEAALAFSASRLAALGDRVSYVCRNVVRGLRDVTDDEHPYQLVLAGGLFDYLPDKVAGMVLRHARERLLAPGGRIIFTNIAHPNPYRLWIEYLAEWHLIHRTEDDVRDLCIDAGFSNGSVTVSREGTGLTMIVECLADSH